MSEAQENTGDAFDSDVNDAHDGEQLESGGHDDSAPRGYMTKEAWTASGKDPKDWVSEEIFKERGYHIQQTAALKREAAQRERDFDNRIKNLSLLHQVQLKNQREDLLNRRDDAIDVADKGAVKAIDKQLKDLDDMERLNTPQEVASSATKSKEILEWEEDNPWCMNPNDERLILAQRIFSEQSAKGVTHATALRRVDEAIKAKFSVKSNSTRQIAEGSRSSSSKRDDSGPVTMKNLSRDEQRIWDTGLFKDEKTFLKAVADDRKGAR